MMREIAEALQHLHEQDITHGDLKMLNVLRVDNKSKLIDFDASASIGPIDSFIGAKFSSGNLSPELFHKLKNQTEIDEYNTYFEKISSDPNEADLWLKVMPVVCGKKGTFVVKTFLPPDKVGGNGKLPYDLIPASRGGDIWAFGVML